ncbi:MAG: L-serine ammonia-lyase, partial [Candidatus Raymondbacteria bacterium RifOxyC12_full_50_8]
ASHTMGPRTAAELFLKKAPNASSYRVTLYGSLALTGKGHMTHTVIKDVFRSIRVNISWKPKIFLPLHPNGMKFEALDKKNKVFARSTAYSIGGGAIREEQEKRPVPGPYKLKTLGAVVAWAQKTGRPLWDYVDISEGPSIWAYLSEIWKVMRETLENGLQEEGVLPGRLKLARKARSYFMKAKSMRPDVRKNGLIYAYALAVAEENASASRIVTAPTCGAAGVLPAVLYYVKTVCGLSENKIVQALATAGIIGNVVKSNASISGAEVGCQGEIGTACAMAAGAVCQLYGGTSHQIEYAAEMGLEHHLGLTCDPVAGLVQIPCIERNAFAAVRAVDCAEYALLSDGRHCISFDDVVKVMKKTGTDLKELYKETSTGGLASLVLHHLKS